MEKENKKENKKNEIELYKILMIILIVLGLFMIGFGLYSWFIDKDDKPVDTSKPVSVDDNQTLADNSIEGIMKQSAVIDNKSSKYVSGETGINFNESASDTNGKGVYIKAGTENDKHPIYYYRGDVNNNIYFANKCWKIVRTTSTGGIKLIYSGENYGSKNEPSCDHSEDTSRISVLDENDEYQSEFKYNKSNYSPAFVGYMYGEAYKHSNSNWTNGAKFGSSFTWDGKKYKLVDATVTSPDNNHHYSCNSKDAEATCTSIRYVYGYIEGGNTDYITLTGGDGIEEALTKMYTNKNDSIAKENIESWYAANMKNYTNQLEDAVYCNDRSMSTRSNGWIANGGVLNRDIEYSPYERLCQSSANFGPDCKVKVDLSCPNKNDAFTWKNSEGNQKLKYPVGMITVDEIVLAGGSSSGSNSYVNSAGFWTMSPACTAGDYVRVFDMDHSISLNVVNDWGYVSSEINGLRPIITLKPGTKIDRGSGTISNPYIIDDYVKITVNNKELIIKILDGNVYVNGKNSGELKYGEGELNITVAPNYAVIGVFGYNDYTDVYFYEYAINEDGELIEIIEDKNDTQTSIEDVHVENGKIVGTKYYYEMMECIDSKLIEFVYEKNKVTIKNIK